MKDIALRYAARIVEDVDGFNVTFDDFEDVFTCGDTYEEAVFNAQEVLELMLEEYLEADRDIPEAREPEEGEVAIPVGVEIAVPVMLKKCRLAVGKTQGDVAKAMGVSYQRYQNLERPGANITLKTLKRAAQALGAMATVTLKVPDKAA